jgi:protein-L-isoaspartate O-methyltransferase
MKKQVDKSHYEFGKYVPKPRWASMWHQLDEVIKLNPERVLEIGPGPGLFKALAGAMGIHVETLDLDPDLKPDHAASVLDAV